MTDTRTERRQIQRLKRRRSELLRKRDRVALALQLADLSAARQRKNFEKLREIAPDFVAQIPAGWSVVGVTMRPSADGGPGLQLELVQESRRTSRGSRRKAG